MDVLECLTASQTPSTTDSVNDRTPDELCVCLSNTYSNMTCILVLVISSCGCCVRVLLKYSKRIDHICNSGGAELPVGAHISSNCCCYCNSDTQQLVLLEHVHTSSVNGIHRARVACDSTVNPFTPERPKQRER